MMSLGHRSGAVIVVRTDSPARTIKDLRGRRVAIPNRFAVDHLFVRGMLKEHGMTVRDVEQVEMAPEMPAALYASEIDAYATGEAFRGGRGGREVRAASRNLDDSGLHFLEALADLRIVAGDDQVSAARRARGSSRSRRASPAGW
jgi:NMT1/THI5 like